ncbi:ABC transporter permease [Sediminibacterium ginsengisoli]|uniref:ABC-type antimicrobial peptide transport system, permease component n=1 Tax=Sediminibacterium ginsengisoli TaxID=413434 RepID=A0A1T4PKG0_9BACT|nr:ABC transporter permease [Sediminibacterium ginsengisoli]SJZ91368.1 ABC-type antimicrobial peptide transport system, permease component [Sediminibacterium ginsengisoli]
MFKNYLKIAYRNLMRNKSFSLINISGLAVGMASAILIFLWIHNEISYDQFHEKKDRIYEAWNRDVFSGKLQCWNTTPKVLARTLEKDFPEVESAVRVNWPSSFLLSIGEKNFAGRGNMVDSLFFDMFTIPFVKGNSQTALKETYSIVITETFAKTLFGNEEPMGKTIRIDNKDNFTVTAVVKDAPNNTRFRFDYIMPWSYLRKQGNDDEYWGNNSTRTYVLLKPNASLASINEKMKTLRKTYDSDEPKGEMFLYPISRWRLYSKFENGKESGGLIEFVRMFSIIAIFLLLIACINFMNLSTARSERRAKEVGIRKVVGASKFSLIGQFLGESILIAFISGVLAIIIVQLSLPAFNKLTDKILFIDYSNAYSWLFFIGFILFTGMIAGSYPAFYLSAFKPVKVLKGTFQKTRALITPRRVLVVLQFTFAIILIISTIIVKEQIHYAKNRETGYDKNKLAYMFIVGDIEKNYELIKNELLSSGTAVSITKTSAPMTQGWSDTWGIEWEGKAKDDKTDFDRFCADDHLATTVGLQMVAGRDFDLKKYNTDSSAVLLNESAVKAMGFKDPLGKTIRDNGKEWHVVGVFKDFILQSPFFPTKPMVIEGAKGWFNVMHIKYNDKNNMAANVKSTEAIVKKYNPMYTFEHQFVDDEYNTKFKAEQRTGTLATLFAGLTIFISCLGLFGLAAYTAESRIKEIGVRKVLGASITSITSLLSKDFIKLVLISFVIASPIAWWLMYNWLQNYPYRISIHWWIFLAAALTSIAIALITVSYHAIRAAKANPVKSLRTE